MSVDTILDSKKLYLIAGSCAIEDRGLTMEIAKELNQVASDLGIPLIYKGSYRKANRTKLDSFTGIGDEKALKILGEVRDMFGIPTITDVHESQEVELAAKYVNVLQIPAFLCRQTSLLIAAAKSNCHVNIKKGQFMSAEAMQHAMVKVQVHSKKKVMLTERGNSFGYQDLVVDIRNIPIMKSFGASVVMDCTHAQQRPNQNIGVTSGTPEFIETLALASIAAGADALFIETHPEPSKAKSDGSNMLPLSEMKSLLEKVLKVHKAIG